MERGFEQPHFSQLCRLAHSSIQFPKFPKSQGKENLKKCFQIRHKAVVQLKEFLIC